MSNLEDIYEEAPAAHQREVVYRGLGWTVLKGVFAPYPTFSSIKGITKKNREMYEGRRVLDLGSGAGVRGIIAKLAGAEAVVASDISFTACVNTMINSQRHEAPVEVVCADMFNGINSRFDTIAAYLPSRDAPVEKIEERAIHDPGFRLNKQLIIEAPDYLINGGTLHTSFLDQDSIGMFKELIDDRGYSVDSHTVRSHETGDWHFYSLRWEG